MRFAGGGPAFREFERQQNAAADFERVLDGLEAGRESLPFVVAEIGVAGAGGNDQVIVGNFLNFVSCFAFCILLRIFLYSGLYYAAFKVEAGDFGHEHFNVLVTAAESSG